MGGGVAAPNPKILGKFLVSLVVVSRQFWTLRRGRAVEAIPKVFG